MPVPELAATVTLDLADEMVVGDRRFADLATLLAAPHEGESRLCTAAIARLTAWLHERGMAVPSDGFTMTWTTTIPRAAGLAGSSALVIGALRSLARLWNVDVPDTDGPRLALEVEVDLLGIAAGPQDRIVQWHGTPLLMDFASTPWELREVHPPAPIEMLVCWTDAARRSSDATHAPLQQRREDPEVRGHMAALAVLARDAAGAVEAGDLDAFGLAIDAGFEHRRALVALDPVHIELVEGLRALGAAVTYTGSGGAGLVDERVDVRDHFVSLIRVGDHVVLHVDNDQRRVGTIRQRCHCHLLCVIAVPTVFGCGTVQNKWTLRLLLPWTSRR
jgi:glucuronokinase